ERLDESSAALVVENAHVVGLAHMQVDGAVVHRGVRAFPLHEAQHRARLRLDDRVGLRARRAEREAGGGVVTPRPDEARLRLLQLTGLDESFGAVEGLTAEEDGVTVVQRRFEGRREDVAVPQAGAGAVWESRIPEARSA